MWARWGISGDYWNRAKIPVYSQLKSVLTTTHDTHNFSQKVSNFPIHGSSGQRNYSIEKIILFQLYMFWKTSLHLQTFPNAWNWARRTYTHKHTHTHTHSHAHRCMHVHTHTHVFPLNTINILSPIYPWRNWDTERDYATASQLESWSVTS